jgi:hypothetical protein
LQKSCERALGGGEIAGLKSALQRGKILAALGHRGNGGYIHRFIPSLTSPEVIGRMGKNLSGIVKINFFQKTKVS